MNQNHGLSSPEPPSVVLLGLDQGARDGLTVEDSLDELALLVQTWGGQVVASMSQTRLRPDPSHYVGRGKLKEAGELAHRTGAGYLVADSELTPVQLRNIEKELDLTVLDRTQVILEIFAGRAHSREGKLEVELAQSVYALPRLAGKGLILSRLGGGIGTRGPGETKLEVDRRRLKDRISFLRREIAEVGRQREVKARSRRTGLAPLAALVGYTNAGKSSLFNRLTGAGALVEDKLFATLDPVIRKLDLPNNQRVLLSDTVGFIRKLPHHLVAAFRGTLEEVREADVLIHVIDASNSNWPAQQRAAERVLGSIGAGTTPVIFALNKVDRLPGGSKEAISSPEARTLARDFRVVAVSALTGEGVERLPEALIAEFAGRRRVFHLNVPYDRQNFLPILHERGRVISEDYTSDGVRIEVELETVLGRRFEAALAPGGGKAHA